MKRLKESDLYPPVKDFFENRGYTVRGEVQNCDLAAEKGGELIVVEIKKQINISLLYQAIDRQRFSNQVYIACTRPKKNQSKAKYIAERLGLGLIFVNIEDEFSPLDIVALPIEKTKVSNKKYKVILQEINNRLLDTGGGLNQKKYLTSFRESNIKIASALKVYGKPASSKFLQENFDCPEKTGYAMRRNYYGWFEKIDTGMYQLSEDGERCLAESEFTEVFDFYMKKFQKEQADV